MSMELFVILAMGDVPNSDELNIAANDLEVPIVWESNINLTEHSGFLPATLETSKSGVETYIIEYSDLGPYLPEHNISSIKEPVVLSFRYGGNFQEAAVAMYSAYILSVKYNAITFEPQGGTFPDSAQLLDAASSVKNFNL